MRRVSGVLLLCGLGACTMPSPAGPSAHDAPDEVGRRSLFYTGTSRGTGDLLAPTITLRNDETEQTVVLIGMVHLADASFYDGVAADCETADCTLLEGVRGSPSLSPLLFVESYAFGLTRRATYYTGLSSQGDAFLPPPNARNGDVAAGEWQSAMPWYTPLSQTIVAPFLVVLAEPLNLLLWTGDLLTHATLTNRAFELRVRDAYASFMARDDDADDDSNDALLPGVIAYRNEKLLERVDQEFADASVKTIALPWGSAHLADLRARLEKRGFKVTESHWRRCWSVAAADEATPDAPSWFYVPYLLHWRSDRGGHTFALALDSIYFADRPGGTSRFELLWDVLFSIASDPPEDAFSWRIGPQLFGRPLLLDRERNGEAVRWRFLWFGRIGAQ